MNTIIYDKKGRFLKNFQKLPDMITRCHDRYEFEKKFMAVFGSDEARKTSNVIYVWTSDKPITRVRDESIVLYIGQTIQSLYKRHYPYHSTEINDSNWKRYEHILNNYGAFHFYYKIFRTDRSSLLQIEKNLIFQYYKKHFEYPPINARN